MQTQFYTPSKKSETQRDKDRASLLIYNFDKRMGLNLVFYLSLTYISTSLAVQCPDGLIPSASCKSSGQQDKMKYSLTEKVKCKVKNGEDINQSKVCHKFLCNIFLKFWPLSISIYQRTAPSAWASSRSWSAGETSGRGGGTRRSGTRRGNSTSALRTSPSNSVRL